MPKNDKFHKLGPGGYAVAMPKWDKFEKEMEDAGVTPVTRSWPPRCRTWFYAHGGELDPKTGKVSTKACLNGADDNLLVAIEEARTKKRHIHDILGRTKFFSVIPMTLL